MDDNFSTDFCKAIDSICVPDGIQTRVTGPDTHALHRFRSSWY
jgi:hypothetical protein